VSLAATARELLAHWTRPLYLVDLDHKDALILIVNRASADTGTDRDGKSGNRPPRLPSGKATADWIENLPDNDWLLLELLDKESTASTPGARWRLAAELVRRHPAAPRGFGLLGQVLVDSGWPGPATAAFLRAAELDPTEPAYPVGAGLAAFDYAEYDRARELLLRAQTYDHGEWKETIQSALEALDVPSESQQETPMPADR